jgi:hypothetical protein
MQNDGTGSYYASGVYYRPTVGTSISGTLAGVGSGGGNPTTQGNGSCDKCRAELKYHPVDYPIVGYVANHSFWDVHQGSDPGRNI